MDIEVNVVNQELKIATNLQSFTEGTQEFIRFIFNMSEDWDELVSFAQFIQNDVGYNVYLDENNSVFLPSEITEGVCYLVLCGCQGDTIAVTRCLPLYFENNMLIGDGQSTEITRSLYEQLVSATSAVRDLVEWVDQKATEAQETATAAQASADSASAAATVAWDKADDAETAAAEAWEKADDAETAAATATSAAQSATSAASAAWTKASDAEAAASAAWDKAGDAEDAASYAWNKAVDAETSAASAAASASSASASAASASRSANGALSQLSIVEDVVGTLAWITEHGTYALTADTEVVPGKHYFSLVDGSYYIVTNPTGSPVEHEYYELASIDEAVSNYVAAHLALTDAGLWVTNDDNSYKILLASDGMKIYDDLGTLVATFGESINFSATRPQYIGGEDAYIIFYDSDNDGISDSINIGGTNVTFLGNKRLSDILTSLDISTTQTANGAEITVGNDTISLSNGHDAVILRIDSSRGNVFKNSMISTVMTVNIISAGETITNATRMHEVFGDDSYLQWYWKKANESDFNIILPSDSMLSNSGFTLTLTPDRVDSKVTFQCELIEDILGPVTPVENDDDYDPSEPPEVEEGEEPPEPTPDDDLVPEETPTDESLDYDYEIEDTGDDDDNEGEDGVIGDSEGGDDNGTEDDTSSDADQE